MLAQVLPSSYDEWKLMDGTEDCIPEEKLIQHKLRRLSDQGLSCKDCRNCDQYSDGTWYCSATWTDGIDPEDGFCEEFDDGRDWGEDYYDNAYIPRNKRRWY